MKIELGTVGHFGLTNNNVTILKRHRVAVEDPGGEIGPEAPGSPNMGVWFHDPDGYRWELSVQAKARAR